MNAHAGDLSSEQLGREVAALGERLTGLRNRDVPWDPDSAVLLQELESAHEELRVADEEVRVQGEQLNQAMNSHRAERLRHERLIAVVPVPVLVTDVNGVIETANTATAAMMRLSLHRLQGKPIVTLVDEADRSELRRDLSRLARGAVGSFRRVVTFQARHGDSVRAELVATLARDEVHNVSQITFLVVGSSPEPGRHGALEPQAVAAAFGDLTRLPLRGEPMERVLTDVARICEEALAPGTSVSVTLGDPAAPDVVATTARLAQEVDGAQIVAGEGPCVTAWEHGDPVWSPDLRRDERWPKLARRLEDTAVREAAAAPVRGGQKLLGALNVYRAADAPAADALQQMVDLLAGAVSAVLEEIDLLAELESAGRNLEEALRSRASIDQAKGMIMALHGCTADEAFALLAQLSSRHNVKVREIAARLVAETSSGRPLRRI